jgi:predicted HAD superfamily Cof-like phosphohydrolase
MATDTSLKTFQSMMEDGSYKKLLNKFKNNPDFRKVLDSIQNTASVSSDKTAKDKLKSKLKDKKTMRTSMAVKKKALQKNLDKMENETKNKNTDANVNVQDHQNDDKHAAENIVSKSLKNAKKKKNNKLRKVHKKIGIVSHEQYVETLKSLNSTDSLPEHTRNRLKNIVDLYVKQNSCKIEKTLEDSNLGDDESDSEYDINAVVDQLVEKHGTFEKMATELNHFDLVGEFHDVFDHPKRTTLYKELFDDTKLPKFRYDLIKEEFDEFMDAFKENDVVEMADALCDMAYVVNGAGHCFGMNLCNVKSSQSQTTCGASPTTSVSLNIGKMNTEMKSYIDAVDTNDLSKLQTCLVSMLNIIHDLANCLGFDFDKMFREVHRSNMTKVCKTIEEAQESVNVYEKKGMTDIDFREKNGYYVVYNKATSKILKNHKWEHPNIRQFIV